jgi:hypothetical protein
MFNMLECKFPIKWWAGGADGLPFFQFFVLGTLRVNNMLYGYNETFNPISVKDLFVILVLYEILEAVRTRGP